MKVFYKTLHTQILVQRLLTSIFFYIKANSFESQYVEPVSKSIHASQDVYRKCIPPLRYSGISLLSHKKLIQTNLKVLWDSNMKPGHSIWRRCFFSCVFYSAPRRSILFKEEFCSILKGIESWIIIFFFYLEIYKNFNCARWF